MNEFYASSVNIAAYVSLTLYRRFMQKMRGNGISISPHKTNYLEGLGFGFGLVAGFLDIVIS